MKVSDLVDAKVRGAFYDHELLKCNLVAHDAKNGKLLFDTAKNKREYIEKFKTGEVVALWADTQRRGNEYGSYYVPVIKCYVSHDSWKEDGAT